LRLLIDMNLSPPWIEAFERQGYEATHWSRVGDPGALDQNILEWARRGRRPHQATFFSTMFVRRLDVLGYARLKHWRIYGEEGLARCEVAVWLGDYGLAVEYGGEALSRYDVSFSPDETRLENVTNPLLFATRYRSPQLKLFALEDALRSTG